MAEYSDKPGFTFTSAPPKEAVDYLKRKGWKASYDYRDVWREEHATAFTVAKAMSLDVLDTIRQSVQQAIQQGTTLRDFQQGLQPRLQQLGWWGVKPMQDGKTGETRDVQLGSPRRLATIYNANLRTAYAAGQWAGAERNKATHPYLLYELGPSKHHRPQHLAWDGTLLPLDDPWWRQHMPPNGWGCKCRVRSVSRAEFERLKQTGVPDPTAPTLRDGQGNLTGRRQMAMKPVQTEAPPTTYRNWRNTRTGQVERVPDGIDPGWDTNPGLTRKLNVDLALAGKLEAADPTVAQVALRDLAGSGALAAFLQNPRGAFPVLRLNDAAAGAIEARLTVGVLSEDSARKNLRRHADLTLADYQALPDLGGDPTVIVQDGENTIVIVRRAAGIYWAAVKAARAGGQQTFVTSFHRAHPKAVDALVRKGRVIYGKWEG